MNLEDYKNEYMYGRELRAAGQYINALEAEVERLQAEAGMNEVFQAEIDLRINDAEKAEAEIERLRARLPGNDAPWTLKELDDVKAEREKLIGALMKIKRDILEPDKIYIHLSRALGAELERLKEQGK